MYVHDFSAARDLARVAMVHTLCSAIDAARGLAATDRRAERRVHDCIYHALLQDAADAARPCELLDPRSFATRLYANYRRMTAVGGRTRARYARPKIG